MESSSPRGPVPTISKGLDLAPQIQPLCTDGSTSTPCPDGKPKSIVFLFLGMSNCALEICGGTNDAWTTQREMHIPPLDPLVGEPCATHCRNLGNTNGANAWNNDDPTNRAAEQSFIYRLYNPTNPVGGIGTSVIVFSGALGQLTLNKWDPTINGWYWNHQDCRSNPLTDRDPECEYTRIQSELQNNGFSEQQVQAVFLRSADPYPQCDLKGLFCNTSITTMPDAIQQELFMGDILRYLKCCKLDALRHSTGIARYPNLKQVFVTSQTYDGYANQNSDCLLPEPYAYEGAFAVQHLIVDQIDRSTASNINCTTDCIGDVRYPEMAPWVNWGPYLWANADAPRSDGFNWCNHQSSPNCNQERDVRDGDLTDPMTWPGDYTHPSSTGLGKIASQLVNFVSGTTVSPFISPWIGQNR